MQRFQETQEHSQKDLKKGKERRLGSSFKARSQAKREKILSLKIAQGLAVQGRPRQSRASQDRGKSQTHASRLAGGSNYASGHVGGSNYAAGSNLIVVPKGHSYDDAFQINETESKDSSLHMVHPDLARQNSNMVNTLVITEQSAGQVSVDDSGRFQHLDSLELKKIHERQSRINFKNSQYKIIIP